VLCAADSYSGEYKNGRRSGTGKYTFASGTVYEGDYVNNAKVSPRVLALRFVTLLTAVVALQHGTGTMKYPDGSSYEGGYKMDKRHGQGVYTYANGDTYAGGWANGVKHGKGCYFFTATKCQFLGYWEAAKFTAGTVCARPHQ
jgi:radial spoke head protein 1